MTTFVTRETARDAIVALYETNDSWQDVYGYLPGDNEIDGQSPILSIRSGGTRQSMASLHVNPTSYLFIMRSLVLVNDGGDWTEADCEDKLDELDADMRQVVRDNVGIGTGADFLRFDEGQSRTGYSLIGGVLYRWEERWLWADYVAGS